MESKVLYDKDSMKFTKINENFVFLRTKSVRDLKMLTFDLRKCTDIALTIKQT